MSEDIQKYVSSCDQCQRNKSSNSKPHGLLMPLPIAQHPFHTVSMDFLLGLPRTTRGNDQILTIVDKFTKFVHFIPLPVTATAVEVVDIFLTQVFRIHGLPRRLISDRDSKFTGKFFSRWKKVLKIEHSMTSAHHSKMDGASEIMNRWIADYLRGFVSFDQLDWDTQLHLAEFAYNSHKNTSTGYSPFFLCFGRHLVAPNSLTLNQDDNETLVDRINTLKRVHQVAKDCLAITQLRQAKYYDQGRQPLPLKLGQKVLLDNRNLRVAGRLH